MGYFMEVESCEGGNEEMLESVAAAFWRSDRRCHYRTNLTYSNKNDKALKE